MEAEELLRFASELCDRLQLTYLVTGSTATIAYGEPRFTNDIDILIDLPPEKITPFCEAFPPNEFYLNRDTVRAAVREQSQFNLIHPNSGLKIDFIVLTRTEFDQSRVARQRHLPILADRNVSFASPEDVGKGNHRSISATLMASFAYKGRALIGITSLNGRTN